MNWVVSTAYRTSTPTTSRSAGRSGQTHLEHGASIRARSHLQATLGGLDRLLRDVEGKAQAPDELAAIFRDLGVPEAASMSSASGPRTSPTIMRFGLILRDLVGAFPG